MTTTIGETSNPSVSVDLTEEDAALFLAFREHQDVFKTMLYNDVFNTEAGSVILHFNKDGTLCKIDRNQVLFFVAVK